MIDKLTTTQLRRAVQVVGELNELDDLDAYPRAVSRALRSLIPCDHAGYNAIDLDCRRALVVADPPDVVFAGGPETLVQLGHQNPLIVRARAGDQRVLVLSDFITRRELHRTQLYQDVYRHSSLEYQLGAQLPPIGRTLGRASEFVGLSLARQHRDFTPADRVLLEWLRPHFATTLKRLHESALVRATIAAGPGHVSRWLLLVDADGTIAWASPDALDTLALTVGTRLPTSLQRWFTGARAHHRDHGANTHNHALTVVKQVRMRARLVPDAYPGLDALHLTPLTTHPSPGELQPLGLTRRQADVLALILQGHTSPQIANTLSLSRRTVEKHHAAIYARLGVTNKAQAILTALSVLDH